MDKEIRFINVDSVRREFNCCCYCPCAGHEGYDHDLVCQHPKITEEIKYDMNMDKEPFPDGCPARKVRMKKVKK